jgi:isoleucyl-tRNA synthetase
VISRLIPKRQSRIWRCRYPMIFMVTSAWYNRMNRMFLSASRIERLLLSRTKVLPLRMRSYLSQLCSIQFVTADERLFLRLSFFSPV